MARKSRKYEMIKSTVASNTEKATYFCGISVRLSLVNSGKQDEGNSIENQLSICKHFVNKQAELKVADIYIDNGRKGTTFQRPEFNRCPFYCCDR